jgi:hypothetical protein
LSNDERRSEVLSTAATVAVLAATYLLFFAIERVLPLRRSKADLLPRLWVNIVISATAFAAAALLVRPAALAGLSFSSEHSIGLMRAVGLSSRASIPSG